MRRTPSHRPLPLRAAGLCLAAMLLLSGGSGDAQTQDARAQREREALRRQQQMLQQARTELETLRGEKAAAEQARADAQAATGAVQARLDAARNEARAQRAELERLRAQQQDTARRHDEQRAEDDASHRRQQQQLQRELAEARGARDELQRANQRLVALLEQRTAEVADLRKRNAALHALAHEAVERFVGKGTMQTALQDDPLFGLARVRTEDTAEQLRMRIDAQREPPR
jgi:chromosome segregation ATPase